MKAVQEGVLSGARVTRMSQGRTHIRERVAKESHGRKNEARTKLALSASKTEEIVSLAQSLGIDVSRAAREMLYARAALSKVEVAKARRWSA
ncbi:MAG: hypothetical protein MUC90_06165, partial [Thermoplasmata archaeon]|nr:hypothetical protein [Thermoplasmata archaeon]